MDLWLMFTDFEGMEQAHEYPIKGVLTNPTLLALPKLPWKETVSRLNTIGTLPLGLQVVSTSLPEMVVEVKLFHQLVDRKELIVKLPFCKDAVRLMPFIRQLGLAVNVAAVCTFGQAIIALESEPDTCPSMSEELPARGGDGVALVSEVKQYALRCGKSTCIQAASIRTARRSRRLLPRAPMPRLFRFR